MNNRSAEVTLILICSFIFSYVLNFLWEAYHTVYFYVCNAAPKRFVMALSYVSFIDSLLITVIFLIVSALWKDIKWLEKMNMKHVLAVIAAGILIAVVVEYRQGIMLQRWTYNKHMPTIFGIGLTPMIQLSTTGLLSFLLTKRLIYQKKRH